jgi:hypothetical protein
VPDDAPQPKYVGWTPVPNNLIDDVMPRLKDSEWRILCVVARQTLGWTDKRTGRRKRADWITRRQLMRRTGRASAALSRAIETLVKRELLEVTASNGRKLNTAAERRRYCGQVYYSIPGNWGKPAPKAITQKRTQQRETE